MPNQIKRPGKMSLNEGIVKRYQDNLKGDLSLQDKIFKYK
jgi:hypothetical protein